MILNSQTRSVNLIVTTPKHKNLQPQNAQRKLRSAPSGSRSLVPPATPRGTADSNPALGATRAEDTGWIFKLEYKHTWHGCVMWLLWGSRCSSAQDVFKHGKHSELAGFHLCSSTSFFIVLSGDFFPVPYQHLSVRTDFSQFFIGPCQANVYTSKMSISSIHT